MRAAAHSHLSGGKTLSALTERLRRHSRRITGPRQAVLDILRKQAHPLTNREVLAAMPGGQCDLATIYRAMHLLQELGMVKQFDFGDGIARFELVGEGGTRRRHHHHHLVCTGCAHVVEIEDCFCGRIERRIAARNGFKAVTHKLEFFGLCPDCQ